MMISFKALDVKVYGLNEPVGHFGLVGGVAAFGQPFRPVGEYFFPFVCGQRTKDDGVGLGLGHPFGPVAEYPPLFGHV